MRVVVFSTEGVRILIGAGSHRVTSTDGGLQHLVRFVTVRGEYRDASE
jgi:hypothetical protein